MLINSLMSNIPWLEFLQPDELERVHQELTVKQVTKNEYVCRKGEMPEFWYGVTSGLIKANNVSHSGKSITYMAIPSGSWFGESPLVRKDVVRSYDAIAMRDSTLICLPKETFHWLLSQNIAFNHHIIHQINERLFHFIAMIESERFLDTNSRVAKIIAGLFNQHLYPGQSAALKLTQEEVGFLTGLSRQRTNMALKKLESLGYIKINYGEVEVIDLENLRKMGNETYE
jgi:CRP/FNR family transcriptional regulator, cyclic AMP receptor protein